jgi:hypothetical protein
MIIPYWGTKQMMNCWKNTRQDIPGKFLVLGAGATIIIVGLFVNLKKTKS